MALNIKRKPAPTTREVFLPSGGYPYGGKIPAGRLVVKAQSGEIERVLYEGFKGNDGKHSSKPYLKFLEVIRRTVELPAGFDPKNLLSSDVTFLIAHSRALAYGQEAEFEVKCPHCGHVAKEKINIPDDISKNMYPSDFVGTLKFTTSHENEVEFRFLTIADEIKLDEKIRNRVQNKIYSADEYESKFKEFVMCSSIVSVNGTAVQDLDEVHAWLNESLQERDEIAKAINGSVPGLTDFVPMVCAECNQNFNFQLPPLAVFFRPLRKSTDISLPAGVRIGALGKDSLTAVDVKTGEGNDAGCSSGDTGGNSGENGAGA